VAAQGKGTERQRAKDVLRRESCDGNADDLAYLKRGSGVMSCHLGLLFSVIGLGSSMLAEVISLLNASRLCFNSQKTDAVNGDHPGHTYSQSCCCLGRAAAALTIKLL
jgi:hypothetical protein